MTSYRVHYRPSRRGDGDEGFLFIRIIHRRAYRDIPCRCRIRTSEWDPESKTLKLPTRDNTRKMHLLQAWEAVQEDLKRLETIVAALSGRGSFTVRDISREFRQTAPPDTLIHFSDSLARDLGENGQPRTARAYRSAARSITLFMGRDIFMSELSSPLILSYEQHLLERGLKMNTVSFYMRNLRAVYYRAVKTGIVTVGNRNPFEGVFTGVFETRRRALDRQEVDRLAALGRELGSRTHEEAAGQLNNALNYFMFAFHSRGMSFVDVAYLKKSEVAGDTILYKRKKTGHFIEIKVTRSMRRIINHFRKATKGSPYVFPIIRDPGGDHRLQYESGLNRQNRLLKELASMAGIARTLSTHVARHTWATMAKRMGYNISLISEGLGHRDTKITATYLASFERSALDELSTRISGSIKAA